MIKQLTLTLTLAAVAGFQNSAFPGPNQVDGAAQDRLTVSAPSPSAQQTERQARHQIAFIQEDPGYYYAGAWGASNRIRDVRQLQRIIEQADDENRISG